MRKYIIIFILVFLLVLSSCNLDKIVIDDEIIDEIVSTLDNDNKIFINVISKDVIALPFKHKSEHIFWEYDNTFFDLKENNLSILKNGTTIISATYNNKKHLYSITIKNKKIISTVQYGINFYYSFISDDKKIGKNITPNKIVFHNTANTAPAKNEIKWLASNDNKSSTSFHFAVDDKGIYQAIPTTKASYHAGDIKINNNSIGVEIAKSLSENEEEKNSGIKNAAILISLLINYYDIDIDNVITHYDASGKYCPHDIFDRYGLDKFYEDIKKLI